MCSENHVQHQIESPKLLTSIASVETSVTTRNEFEMHVNTLQTSIRAIKIEKIKKHRISAFTGELIGGRGDGRFQSKGHGNRGRKRGGGGQDSQGRGSNNKHPHSDRIIRGQDGDPPEGVTWIEDRFYKPEYCGKFTTAQAKTFYDLRDDNSGGIESGNHYQYQYQSVLALMQRITLVESQARINRPPLPHVHHQIINSSNNSALQQLNQR